MIIILAQEQPLGGFFKEEEKGPIDEFSGEFRWLSNFWPSIVNLDGMAYPTVEHAYQAAKTTDEAARKLIRDAPSPGKAKRMGGKLAIRPDWGEVKLRAMEDLLRQKFAPGSELAGKLVGTGDRPITEGNAWGDVFWGVSKGTGENNLGKLIMRIRDELGSKNMADPDEKP